jgi:hypothetical protein
VIRPRISSRESQLTSVVPRIARIDKTRCYVRNLCEALTIRRPGIYAVSIKARYV